MRERIEGAGARFLTPVDEGYPGELADLHDPPAWLFVRGQPIRDGALRVAIVGSRRCSALGRELAHELGRRLASVGVCVVSGAAAGIDGRSHEGALAAAGPTIAVLGSGIDVAYPRSNGELIAAVASAEGGTVISEYPPGTPARPYHFPARNRIVAALGTGLVVVEGAGKSGSRISVDHALDLGREVFAIPGPVTSPLAEVPLEMIREGATMIRGADDLLLDLGVNEAGPAAAAVEGSLFAADATATGADTGGIMDLSGSVRDVYAALTGPALPDDLARRVGCSIPEAVAALTELEIRGLVRTVGGRYERRLLASRSVR
jgi:DNA processing protein